MGFFFAIFLGLLAYGNITNKPGVTKVEKNIQVNDAKTKDVSPNIAVSKPEPTKLEPIEEAKSEPTKLEPIQEEAKSESSKLEPIQEKSKSELTNDDTKVVDIKDETGTSWLRLILYILGPILFVAIGKYFYTRLRNETPSNNSSKFLRSEFKEEVQTDNTEQQQPAQEEVQTDNTEQQQPAQEEDEDNKKQ